jgi:hypothetical protein
VDSGVSGHVLDGGTVSRIRIIRPVSLPPSNRAVQWFYPGEGQTCIGFLADVPSCPTHWCEAATLTKPSGPVHSLEAQELPPTGKPVLVRVRGEWYRGERQATPAIWVSVAATSAGGDSYHCCQPDAWRPLPDDEPGDAELEEALLGIWTHVRKNPSAAGPRLGEMIEAASKLLDRRSGK